MRPFSSLPPQDKQNEASYLRDHKEELTDELATTILQKVGRPWPPALQFVTLAQTRASGRLRRTCGHQCCLGRRFCALSLSPLVLWGPVQKDLHCPAKRKQRGRIWLPLWMELVGGEPGTQHGAGYSLSSCSLGLPRVCVCTRMRVYTCVLFSHLSDSLLLKKTCSHPLLPLCPKLSLTWCIS